MPLRKHLLIFFLVSIFWACKKSETSSERQQQQDTTSTTSTTPYLCWLLPIEGTNPQQYFLDTCGIFTNQQKAEYGSANEGAVGWNSEACNKCDSILYWQNHH
ncbi:MAG: hypothetical protein NTV09_07450 [Bacteroidetes bacterium]|nr:hypothetical protein [Bacteroidota bacterium]